MQLQRTNYTLQTLVNCRCHRVENGTVQVVVMLLCASGLPPRAVACRLRAAHDCSASPCLHWSFCHGKIVIGGGTLLQLPGPSHISVQDDIRLSLYPIPGYRAASMQAVAGRCRPVSHFRLASATCGRSNVPMLGTPSASWRDLC
jgi:hypothetical protein